MILHSTYLKSLKFEAIYQTGWINQEKLENNSRKKKMILFQFVFATTEILLGEDYQRVFKNNSFVVVAIKAPTAPINFERTALRLYLYMRNDNS